MQTVARARSWRLIILASSAVSIAVACSSSDSNPASTTSPQPDGGSSGTTTTPTSDGGRGATVVTSQSVGPSGGTVSGGGASIDIPAGALTANTTIVISTLPATAVSPPAGTLAGSLYTFQPDDVAFAQPVTITLDVNPSQRPADGSAIVLYRSPTAQNQWSPRGAAEVTSNTVVGQTNHFSDWAMVYAGPACFVAACSEDAGPGGPVGIDCVVPSSGGGVRCSGGAPPYTCVCASDPSTIIASPDAQPSAAVLSALALGCGATCEDAGTTTETDSGADSSVDGGVTCPSFGIDASPGECESRETCSDGHVYYIECNGTGQAGPCVCEIDGVTKSNVTGACDMTTWSACGFPPIVP